MTIALINRRTVSRQLSIPIAWMPACCMCVFRIGAFVAALNAFMVLSACSVMPTSGPGTQAVLAGQQDPEGLLYANVKVTSDVIDALAVHGAPGFANVKVTSDVIDALAVHGAPGFAGVIPDRRMPHEIRLGIGDVVSITIFEASAGGLFIPREAGVRPGNFITLPNQNVDSKGYVSVPYAGAIRAVGLTPREVQDLIVEALKNRAIEPQAVVAMVDQRTSLISVLGDVNTPARFPASATPEHVLDAITRAGGPKSQGFDSWVMLERQGRQATLPFGALVYDTSNNIFVHPNDTIYVYREPQTFVAFGASGQQGQFNFDAWRVSIAEAVAKAGGLNDAFAEPASVFLYRGETRGVAKRLGVDVKPFNGRIIPVIYNLNFRDPAGYFLATKLQLRNKDVLYVSNAVSVEAAKAMQYFRLITATVNDPIVAAVNAKVLRTIR